MTVPQGSERGAPHSVYRRRRIFALIAVAAAAVIVVLIIVRPAPPPAPPPVQVAAPAAIPVPVSTVPLPCAADQVLIAPATDAAEYSEGELPELTWSLSNVSGARCVINIGTSQQALTISSAEGVVWSSADCQPIADQPYLLEPASTGARPAISSPISWNRETSSPDACGMAGDQLLPGTYQLSASVGGFSSATAASFVLD